MPAQPIKHINRARQIVEAAFNNIAGKLLFFSYLRPFSYWDNYYGQHPEITSDFFRLLPYSTIQKYDSKGFVAKKINDLSIYGLFPATYFSVADAIRSQQGSEKIWFVKPTYSTGGKGIQILTNDQLATFELPPHHIIQEQVTNLELINERKYTARAYLFVFDKKLYLFDDGFVMVHGVPYTERATDLATQVEHDGYTSPNSPIKMMRIAQLPEFSQKQARLKQAISVLKPVLDELIEATSNTEYGLLGIDLLFDKDNNPTLIELNSKANFVHTETINNSLNIPFFNAVLSTLYTSTPDPRLTEI